MFIIIIFIARLADNVELFWMLSFNPHNNDIVLFLYILLMKKIVSLNII